MLFGSAFHREGAATGFLGDLEEAGITGSEGTGWDMWLEEVREVVRFLSEFFV